VEWGVCSVQCAVCSVQCAVWSVSRAVTLPNIGVPHYIGVPHRVTYPYAALTVVCARSADKEEVARVREAQRRDAIADRVWSGDAALIVAS